MFFENIHLVLLFLHAQYLVDKFRTFLVYSMLMYI